MMQLLFVLLLLADVYVAPGGNDANPGTQVEPFRTITQGIASAQVGDEVHVAPGTYQEHVLIDKDIRVIGNSEVDTIIDGRGVVDANDDTVAFTHVTSDARLSKFTIYGPSEVVAPATPDDVGSAVSSTYSAKPIINRCIVYGPEKSSKIYTIRPGGESAPRFQQCTIYGGTGTSSSQAKIETVTPWNAFPTFDRCVFYQGKNCVGSHCTVLESGNSHSTFLDCTFEAAQRADNQGATRFRLVSTLNNGTYQNNYSVFRRCVFKGADAGDVPTHIMYLQYDENPWNFSETTITDCHFVLGTGTNGNGYADIHMSTVIPTAGGTFSGNKFWTSVAHYESGVDPIPEPPVGTEPLPEPDPDPVEVTVTMEWDAPTTNADGTPLTDLGGYNVATAESGQDLNDGGVALSEEDVGMDLQWVFTTSETTSVWVLAYDTNGNKSAWTGPVVVGVEPDPDPDPDTTAPDAPTNVRVTVEITVP